MEFLSTALHLTPLGAFFSQLKKVEILKSLKNM